MLSISTVLYCVLPCGEIKMVVILTKCKCTCFINIELCTVMHSVFHGQASSYISDIVTPVTRLPGRANLRSAHLGHCDVPRVDAGLGQRSFAAAGPKAWNSLPSELRCIAVD